MQPPAGGLAGAPRAAARRAATAGPAFPPSLPAFLAGFPRSPSAAFGRLRSPSVGALGWWACTGGGVGWGTLQSSCAPRGKRRSPAPSSLLPQELEISDRFASAATRSAVRAVALQKAPGARASRALEGAAFRGVPLLHIPLPSLFDLPEHSWQCKHGGSYPPEPLDCVLAPVQVQGWCRAQSGGNLQDLVASALSADTLPSYWLSQRPQGGLQHAAYRARLAHFTS